MRGWTEGGREIQLTPWQAGTVEQILAAHREGKTVSIVRGRGWGWTTVMATVKRLEEADSDAQGVTKADHVYLKPEEWPDAHMTTTEIVGSVANHFGVTVERAGELSMIAQIERSLPVDDGGREHEGAGFRVKGRT